MAHITHRAVLIKPLLPGQRPVLGKSLADVLYRLQHSVNSMERATGTYRIDDISQQDSPVACCTLEVRLQLGR